MSCPIDTAHTSPNQSSRAGARISLLVVHATVGSYASSLAWLCSPASKVSCHFLIRKDGHIAQLVPDARAAWHAGVSAHQGMDSAAIMRGSLGIELENANDGHDPYPPSQVAAAHWLCQEQIARYNIERADVVRHLDIAIPRGRKTDPAGLPWPAFADSLYMPSGDNPRPPHLGLTHYRVLTAATGGATIRRGPRTNAAILGRLHPGDDWWGTAVPGQQVYIKGFGNSHEWVMSDDARCVWLGLLEKVRE